MSVHLEYLHAPTVIVEYVNELELAENCYVDNPKGQMVLVLNYDEAIVITGSKQQLLKLAERIVVALDSGGAEAKEGS